VGVLKALRTEADHSPMGTDSLSLGTDRFDPRVVDVALRDPGRLAVLRRAQLLDSLPPGMFDRWTAMVREVVGADVGFVCLVEEASQVLMSVNGARAPVPVGVAMPAELGVCRFVVSGSGPLAVSDGREHAALSSLPAFQHGLVAYLGVPVTIDGQVIGSLSLADHQPREWTDADVLGATAVAAAVETELRLRLANEELSRSHDRLASYNVVHELIAQDAPLEEVLGELVAGVERQDPSVLGCVVLIDREAQTMRHGVARSLPPEYLAAIDGIPIGPDVGSCGTAAWTGRLVISEDLATDPRWRAARELTRAANLRHCWSQPIKAGDGDVIGTFALYGRTPRAPEPWHIALMEDAARVTGIAIERHRAARRLLHGATHDGLTGLLNRTAVLERLEQALARSRRSGAEVAVLFVDLDQMKLLNDTLGHDLTDDLMRAVAARLAGVVREGDAVGRLGGDEYLVIAEDIGGAEHAAKLAERVREAVAAPAPEVLSGAMTASIGVTLVTGATADPRDAIRQADSAMYSAKRAGGDRCRFYEDDPQPHSRQRLALGGELRGAARRGELRLVYQPLFDLRHGGLSSVEALLRWHSPTLGDVSPAEFVPVAEETGLIASMGAWALLEACRAIAGVGRPLDLAVNVSAHQVADPAFARTVDRALVESGLEAERLTLEITETALVKPDSVTTQTLRDLKALGCRVVLDDFGTGYSSLASLKGHPVDGIKIDRSFVDGLPDDRGDSAIVAAVIGMAKALERSVTGEGVENERQLQALRALGCDTAQGFLLARPMPLDELQALLADG
jgi:diguanylate cyclase (GGDEF)-like protein